MKEIPKTLKVTGIISICLWLLGSFILFQERNGISISLITGLIIIAGFYHQLNKDKK